MVGGSTPALGKTRKPRVKNMCVSETSYVCKIGPEDALRLNAQAQLTVIPLQEALTEWTERLDKDAISRLLDFGCGVGASIDHLKDRFPNAKYIGLDRELAQIDVAKNAHPEETFVVGDEKSEIAQGELQKADLVYMQFVAMHQTDLDGFFSYVVANMQPGAQLLIFEPYSDFKKIERGSDQAVIEAQKARFEFSAKVAENVGRTYNAVALFPDILQKLGMIGIAEYRKENMCFPLAQIRDTILIPNWQTARDGERFRSIITVDRVDSYIKTLQEASGDTSIYIGDSRIIIAQKPALA